MANLREVAARAGVSVSTVSRVLNNDESLSVTSLTKEKIMEAAENLQYKKHSQKKKSRTHQIGLLIFCSKDYEYEDEYFMVMRRSIERQAEKEGLSIAVQIREIEKLQDADLLNNLEGLIIVGNISSSIVNQLSRQNQKIVFVDESPDINRFDSVTADFLTATTAVLNHLRSLGHRRIGYIGGTEIPHQQFEDTDFTGIDNLEKMRFLPYKRMLTSWGEYKEEFVHIGGWSTEEGYQMMKKALQQEEGPSAYVVASDPMAVGAIRALHEAGVKVPHDISIVSFNDIQMAKYLNPPLTTVKVPVEQMGVSAVKLIREQIDGRDIPTKLIHPCAVQYRDSAAELRQERVPVK
ncbi:LacI family DNA-binding transcriptional regulator [Alkalicoccus halolimnae]|uniref:LacI family DNA-binding transcriptional regulator n=1 Tax=Alkalicoccus halolimnae TaxID=1667239 RepID=A0A5C7F4F4_9BACI|nr:LacI family DNA-binding transcriptional regulator [Alkalicoccus halolimnae]TXF84634.1 LacI family DNA-binding transcriptional regulator [Alkalicoccus halolimnae]